MRFDLPYEPEITRRRDPDSKPAPASGPAMPVLPESPIDSRLPHLQSPAREVARQSPPKASAESVHEVESGGRKREPEHRPRRTREGVAVQIAGIRLRPEERKLLAEGETVHVVCDAQLNKKPLPPEHEAALRAMMDK